MRRQPTAALASDAGCDSFKASSKGSAPQCMAWNGFEKTDSRQASARCEDEGVCYTGSGGLMKALVGPEMWFPGAAQRRTRVAWSFPAALGSMPRPDSSVVERGPEKAGVGGSIPSLATTLKSIT